MENADAGSRAMQWAMLGMLIVIAAGTLALVAVVARAGGAL